LRFFGGCFSWFCFYFCLYFYLCFCLFCFGRFDLRLLLSFLGVVLADSALDVVSVFICSVSTVNLGAFFLVVSSLLELSLLRFFEGSSLSVKRKDL